MALTMDKRKKSQKDDGGGSASRNGSALHAWVDPDLMAALNEYIDAQEVRTSKTAVVEAAIREWLRARKKWPRQPAPPS